MPDEPSSSSNSSGTSRLPPFQSEDPELWFLQVEPIFLNGATEKEKYSHLMAALPFAIVQRVRDVLVTLSTSETPYTSLKQLLLQRLAPSQEAKLEQLLQGEQLGDRRPSELLVSMLALLGATPSAREEVMVRHLFIKKMPSSTQEILVSLDPALALTDVAATADRIQRVHSPQVSSISAPSPPQPTFSLPPPIGAIPPGHLTATDVRLSLLERCLADLTMEVRGLAAAIQSGSHHHSRSASGRRNSFRRGSPSPGRRSFPNGHCYYHHTFGDKAQKCSPPCAFQGNRQASSQ